MAESPNTEEVYQSKLVSELVVGDKIMLENPFIIYQITRIGVLSDGKRRLWYEFEDGEVPITLLPSESVRLFGRQ